MLSDKLQLAMEKNTLETSAVPQHTPSIVDNLAQSITNRITEQGVPLPTAAPVPGAEGPAPDVFLTSDAGPLAGGRGSVFADLLPGAHHLLQGLIKRSRSAQELEGGGRGPRAGRRRALDSSSEDEAVDVGASVSSVSTRVSSPPVLSAVQRSFSLTKKWPVCGRPLPCIKGPFSAVLNSPHFWAK